MFISEVSVPLCPLLLLLPNTVVRKICRICKTFHKGQSNCDIFFTKLVSVLRLLKFSSSSSCSFIYKIYFNLNETKHFNDTNVVKILQILLEIERITLTVFGDGIRRLTGGRGGRAAQLDRRIIS